MQLNESNHRLVIMGNPVVNGVLKFRSEEAMAIQVKNIDGRIVKSVKAVPGINYVELPNLTAGTYLLTGKGEVVKFMVK